MTRMTRRPWGRGRCNHQSWWGQRCVGDNDLTDGAWHTAASQLPDTYAEPGEATQPTLPPTQAVNVDDMDLDDTHAVPPTQAVAQEVAPLVAPRANARSRPLRDPELEAAGEPLPKRRRMPLPRTMQEQKVTVPTSDAEEDDQEDDKDTKDEDYLAEVDPRDNDDDDDDDGDDTKEGEDDKESEEKESTCTDNDNDDQGEVHINDDADYYEEDTVTEGQGGDKNVVDDDGDGQEGHPNQQDNVQPPAAVAVEGVLARPRYRRWEERDVSALIFLVGKVRSGYPPSQLHAHEIHQHSMVPTGATFSPMWSGYRCQGCMAANGSTCVISGARW